MCMYVNIAILLLHSILCTYIHTFSIRIVGPLPHLAVLNVNQNKLNELPLVEEPQNLKVWIMCITDKCTSSGYTSD